MARPRYKINKVDWHDCLDWLDYQLSQPGWITLDEHRIHTLGISVIKECVLEWREIDQPSNDLCNAAQGILEEALEDEDWARLRKALSAKRRRRKDKQLENSLINITLTPDAHQTLLEFKQLSGAKTLSETIVSGLNLSMAELRKEFEANRAERLGKNLEGLKASEIVKTVEDYLNLTRNRRSLANSCKIAYQLFLKRPDRNSLQILKDRFIEDLIWNEVHLKTGTDELNLFSSKNR